MSTSPLKLALAAAFVLALTFTFSCSGDDSSNTPTPPRKEKISGVSQKGPFNAATVKIYRLDASKKKIGDSVEVKTDGEGKFEIEIEEAQYISIEVTGDYANEAKGGQSEIPITLYAVADVSNKDNANVNINVFTHLEYERVLESTKAFDVAKREAQNKVLGALGMGEINVNSEALSLFGSGQDNAKLLTASVLLQANRETGAVSNLLRKIKDDGDFKNELLEGAEWVKTHISTVEQNIKNLNPNAQVPSVNDINNIVAGINGSSSSGGSSSSSEPLSCTGLPSRWIMNIPIDLPTLLCSNGSSASDVTWRSTLNWSNPELGTYDVGVAANCGNNVSLTASCGTLSVLPPGSLTCDIQSQLNTVCPGVTQNYWKTAIKWNTAPPTGPESTTQDACYYITSFTSLNRADSYIVNGKSYKDYKTQADIDDDVGKLDGGYYIYITAGNYIWLSIEGAVLGTKPACAN